MPSCSWTPTRKAATSTTAAHARSVSQPCHPVLRAWCGAGGASSSSTHDLALLDVVLVALGDLLATPRAVAALHDADQVLDGLLVLADAYDTFKSALLRRRA
ncbi:unnamed protein product [Miscanthus lutarioriparius]|uniref:Uncharacterized protein n=1 Tax=Miscanthus lutarioriparius TaxID=422564 RepID=A0A811SCB0_9POAL|nr:unnamed protein product [Miscanthus lutarioriparius]